MKVAAAVGAQAAHHMNKIAWPKDWLGSRFAHEYEAIAVSTVLKAILPEPIYESNAVMPGAERLGETYANLILDALANPGEADNGLDYIPPIRERLGPEVMERVGKAVEGWKLKQAGNG
jgi:hypothetical protein